MAAKVRKTRLRPGTKVVGRPQAAIGDFRVPREGGVRDLAEHRKVDDMVFAEFFGPGGV